MCYLLTISNVNKQFYVILDEEQGANVTNFNETVKSKYYIH